MTVHEDSVSLGTALSLQEPAFDLGGIEPCLKQQLEAVRQEMAIIMLEGLQRTADACTEICMRAVQEERQVLKVQMAQEELLFALQDEHQRFLRTLKSSSEVERPQEAKVFNLIAEEDTIFNLSSISCPDVASPLDSTDSPWDISWSALPSQTLLGSDVGVQASEEVSGHEVGVQASEDVAGHEVGVQASEDVGGHAVSVPVSQCDDACKLQAQASEDVSGESGTVSSVSSFGMVLEAQAKLHEADELMQRALNVRESELGLSTLALSGNSERLAALRPQQRDVIDATCGEGRLDQYESLAQMRVHSRTSRMHSDNPAPRLPSVPRQTSRQGEAPSLDVCRAAYRQGDAISALMLKQTVRIQVAHLRHISLTTRRSLNGTGGSLARSQVQTIAGMRTTT